MKLRRLFMAGLVLTGSLCEIPVAFAQVPPPHAPGTICFTKQFWCWANPPGEPRKGCACPSPYGWIPGVLG
jgi:hypothetical protein